MEAQLPADSHVDFSPLSENGFMRIAIADPGNHTWNLQVSHDLIFWYEFETITVAVADAPRPNEIMIVMAISDGGRPHPRIGKGRAAT